MILHTSPEPSESESCLSVRHDRKEMITMPRVMCRAGVGAGHVWLDAVEATRPDIEIVEEYHHHVRYRLWILGRQVDNWTRRRQDPSRSWSRSRQTRRVTTADVLPCRGTAVSLVCAGFEASDCSNGVSRRSSSDQTTNRQS